MKYQSRSGVWLLKGNQFARVANAIFLWESSQSTVPVLNEQQSVVDSEQEKGLNRLCRLFTLLLYSMKITSLQKYFMD